MEILSKLQSLALDTLIIFGPTIGYLAQWNMIKKSKSIGSFSTDVCAILIFANIFRIFFWFGKRFEQALLLQSFVMIIFQILLLRECVNIKSQSISYSKTSIVKNFWRWNDFDVYVKVIAYAWGALTLSTFLMNKNSFYVELIGYSSVLVEACLGLPQLISNHNKKSTVGLSVGLIASWVLGDTSKIYYYIMLNQPLQFTLCGALQLVVDFLIVGQIVLYKDNKPNQRKIV